MEKEVKITNFLPSCQHSFHSFFFAVVLFTPSFRSVSMQSAHPLMCNVCISVPALFITTVIREIFIVKKFSFSSKSMKIKRMKYFQRTYYVIERELNYRRVQKFFNTNILHTNIS